MPNVCYYCRASKYIICNFFRKKLKPFKDNWTSHCQKGYRVLHLLCAGAVPPRAFPITQIYTDRSLSIYTYIYIYIPLEIKSLVHVGIDSS